MPPHIFIYLFMFYRQPHIFIFHLVCYVSKCLRVETSFWTGGCTHTPAKCQSSYMRKKCIASNLITTCRILIKKKKKKILYLVVWRREVLPSSFFLLYFSSLMLSFIPQFVFLLQFVCSVLLSRLVTKGKAEGIANCSQLLLLSTLIIQVENKTSCPGIVWYPQKRGTFFFSFFSFVLWYGSCFVVVCNCGSNNYS